MDDSATTGNKAASSKKASGLEEKVSSENQVTGKKIRAAPRPDAVALTSTDNNKAEAEASVMTEEIETAASESAPDTAAGEPQPASPEIIGEARATSEEVNDEGQTGIEDPVDVNHVDERTSLAVDGKVVAIYDSIWTMEDTDTIKVFPDYQGETIVIKAFPPRLDSQKSKTYEAYYTAGPYKAVYSCERGNGFQLLHSFTIDQANEVMVTDLASDPLTFRFVDQLDSVWNQDTLEWDSVSPYLFLEVHVDKAKGHYFGSWAKRRQSDDEVMTPQTRTMLSSKDIERLWMRHEINMQHPAWSRFNVQAAKMLRPWWKE